MNIHELYDLNLKIRKGEASKKEKEIYKREYITIKAHYLFAHDNFYPIQFDMMIPPRAVDRKRNDVITKYIRKFEKNKKYGKWHGGIEDKKPNEPIFLPSVNYSKDVMKFIEDIYKYGFMDFDYLANHDKIKDKSIDDYTIDDIFTELTFYIRGDRFCEGVLLRALDDGTILKLLKALKERIK